MNARSGAGALGPRLAGRLTAELVLRSPQYMNAVKDYEIDLRGNKISAIENLGATENQFDSIDLSDNAIARLEGFPKLHRLKVLLLSNNRLMRIAPHLEEHIPNLEWLILSNNRLNNLQDLDPLQTLSRLKYLSLLDNPVSKKPNYRLYVIHKCQRMKVLDFKKVKQKEREQAARMYGGENGTAAAAETKTFEPDEELAAAEAQVAAETDGAAQPSARKGPTPAQVTAIKAAIANAATLEEMHRLEEALKTGHLPSEVVVGVEAEANGDQPSAMEEG